MDFRPEPASHEVLNFSRCNPISSRSLWNWSRCCSAELNPLFGLSALFEGLMSFRVFPARFLSFCTVPFPILISDWPFGKPYGWSRLITCWGWLLRIPRFSEAADSGCCLHWPPSRFALLAVRFSAAFNIHLQSLILYQTRRTVAHFHYVGLLTGSVAQ